MVHRVRIGAGGDEHLCDLDMVAERGEQQGSSTTIVVRLDRGAIGERGACPSGVAFHRGGEQLRIGGANDGHGHCRPISAACSAAAVSPNFSGLAWMTTSCSVPVNA